jgi:CDP-paratose 2-epimerase
VHVLVTGGAGFVGANTAVELAARHPGWRLVALDNLHRRGAELNVTRLREAGVAFIHGDVRSLDDLLAVGEFDALIECSAEPSALAGRDGHPGYVVGTNLLGAFNCLELVRRHGAYLMFLSTSRVYPVAALRSLVLDEAELRYELAPEQPLRGASADGIAEDLPLDGARTLYGSTKLAAELLIEEYRDAYGIRAVVDRCGVIAGPWQFGKIDQGVFTHWLLAHHFRRPLQYIGFGGHGKQVRDLLHIADLIELLDAQLDDPERWDGATVNVGGGRACSLSLKEATVLCEQITGNSIEVASAADTRPGDVPLYISDCRTLFRLGDWRPQRDAEQVLSDIHAWICAHESDLKRITSFA